jgi:hypothetical protein
VADGSELFECGRNKVRQSEIKRPIGSGAESNTFCTVGLWPDLRDIHPSGGCPGQTVNGNEKEARGNNSLAVGTTVNCPANVGIAVNRVYSMAVASE